MGRRPTGAPADFCGLLAGNVRACFAGLLAAAILIVETHDVVLAEIAA